MASTNVVNNKRASDILSENLIYKVVHDKTKGFFLDTDDTADLKECISNALACAEDVAVEKALISKQKELAGLEKTIERYNKEMSKSEGRNAGLLHDIETIEDRYALTLESLDEVTLELEKARFTTTQKLKELTALALANDEGQTKEAKAPLFAEITSLQRELSDVKKELNIKRKEGVSAKFRVAAIKKRMAEEGRHFTDLQRELESRIEISEKTGANLDKTPPSKFMDYVPTRIFTDMFSSLVLRQPTAGRDIAHGLLELAVVTDPAKTFKSLVFAKKVHKDVVSLDRDGRSASVELTKEIANVFAYGQSEEHKSIRAQWALFMENRRLIDDEVRLLQPIEYSIKAERKKRAKAHPNVEKGKEVLESITEHIIQNVTTSIETLDDLLSSEKPEMPKIPDLQSKDYWVNRLFAYLSPRSGVFVRFKTMVTGLFTTTRPKSPSYFKRFTGWQARLMIGHYQNSYALSNDAILIRDEAEKLDGSEIVVKKGGFEPHTIYNGFGPLTTKALDVVLDDGSIWNPIDLMPDFIRASSVWDSWERVMVNSEKVAQARRDKLAYHWENGKVVVEGEVILGPPIELVEEVTSKPIASCSSGNSYAAVLFDVPC